MLSFSLAFSLFTTAFLAATILPVASEGALAAALALSEESWDRKWGRASLLLSWAPIFGDLLTVAAGAMREPLHIFIPLVAIAKTGRYIVVAAAVSGLV